MAKDSKVISDSQADSDVQRLARDLFIANWKPANLGQTPEALAAFCFRGAQTFLRVSSRVREGQSLDDILSSPSTTVTPSV